VSLVVCSLYGAPAALAQGSAGATQASPDTAATSTSNQSPAWAGALKDTLSLLVVENTARALFEAETRRELGGNFFGDYVRSVRFPRHWGDSDGLAINDIGHPLNGAAAGFIWIDHDPHAPSDFVNTKSYWISRLKATGWAAGYSLQFEVGPLLSEAAIGNVGMRPETTGWTDHILTPIGGLGMIVGQDVLDRYVVMWIEEHTRNPYIRAAARMALNPSRMLSNGVSGRVPWDRDGRPIRWTPPHR
jgi:hypothetical protein